MRYTMQRLVREGQGTGGGSRHGGWQWINEKGGTGIIDGFRAEFGITPQGAGDPKWYPSNSSLKRLADCWKEAQAIRNACLSGSDAEEERLYRF